MHNAVSGKTVKRPKHIPQRTCVGCRQVLPKRSLVRVARGPDGVQVDPTGKRAGRGAYLHDQRTCWEKGLKGALAHALKTNLKPADLDLLVGYMQTLPEEPAGTGVEQ
ncbi:MAG: YlxR family protein [Chloroflexi bacterium]|nr:YlxR family protein [Chloroflexota bacterium]